MEQGVWQEIEQLYQKFQKLGISESVDYDKYYLYSLITHSTAIEGSTLTELDTQLLFDEGVTAKGKPLVHHLMNEDLKQAYELAKAESEPLFDKKGNVIGIVSAKHSGAENVGYAIKTMYLRNLVESCANASIIPTNNTISTLALTGKVKKEKSFVFFINCSK